tara:strand:+ start:1285 stop:1518 length:234 start_codon:yes stop_codon:yes gene_type:complete
MRAISEITFPEGTTFWVDAPPPGGATKPIHYAVDPAGATSVWNPKLGLINVGHRDPTDPDVKASTEEDFRAFAISRS